MQPPTVRSVNVLYLIAVVLFFVTAIALSWMPTYVRLIITEILVILLSALIYLRVRNLPVRETIRLRWPGFVPVLLGIVIGAAVWFIDAWLSGVVVFLLGYEVPIPPDFYPQTVDGALLAFVALAVAAPICEEVLFRGVIQPAYERRGIGRAVLAVGLMFILYHMSLQQGLAIVPLAFVVCYIVWRTGSIIPAILVHFANNLIASLMVTSLAIPMPFPDFLTPSPVLALAGLLLLIVSLLVLEKTSPKPVEALPPEPISWPARVWPLALVIPVWLLSVGLEVLVSHSPGLMAFGQDLTYESAPWIEEQQWRYEIRSRTNQPVGSADCVMMTIGSSVVLECSMSQSAYQADTSFGFFADGDTSQQHTIRWDAATMLLEEAHFEGVLDGKSYVIDVEAAGSGLGMSGEGPDGSLDAADLSPGDVLNGGGIKSPLMVGEWPWRFSALPLALAYAREVPAIWPFYSETSEVVEEETMITVRTAEPLSTPAGDFVTWRVTFGDTYRAWYHVNAPYTLVGFDDGMVTWLLAE